METLNVISRLISLLFVLCYGYQFAYLVIALIFRRRKDRREKAISLKKNRYAVLVCARNEEEVIGDLVRSIGDQTYPSELTDVYVMADNCTDGTAATAEGAGATVFERHDRCKVGKGYALDALLGKIRETEPAGYDGYFVFDADNVLAEDYIEQMDRTFSQGYDIVTGYRNSKNYGSNWISAGYGLWFIRESVFLNFPRYLAGSSCTVSGTGFMFSRQVAEEMDGWPYHTLTEDLEFSSDQITRGKKIAFCRDAELFDEQPVDLKQSWNQRMRWCRGFLQVFRLYGGRLLEGIADGSFSCFDCAMSIMPAFVLSVFSGCIDLAAGITGMLAGEDIAVLLTSVASKLTGSYLLMILIGALTLASEWDRIKTGAYRKILYLFAFPLFMLTYVPIAAASLFVKVEWTPIRHSFSVKRLREIEMDSRGAV